MRRVVLLSWIAVVCAVAGCGPASKTAHDAREASRSWAATVTTVTEQWAQSRVSQRFTRTMLDAASTDLHRQLDSVRTLDPELAGSIARLTRAIEPVLAAVERNEPGVAREGASGLMRLVDPAPSEEPRDAAPDAGGPRR